MGIFVLGLGFVQMWHLASDFLTIGGERATRKAINFKKDLLQWRTPPF
jgi:hypothetical protein